MIELSLPVGPLLNRTKWFAQSPSWSDAFRLVKYMQSTESNFRPGFIRQPFQTKVIDLTVSEDEIFNQFTKSTQYKIRRARREGVTCHFDGEPSLFRCFYNQIAEGRGQKPIPRGLIEAAAPHICISYAKWRDTILVMGCALIDRTLSRARGWYIGSHHGAECSSEQRQRVGRANRLLYFEEMLYFKSQNTSVYDLGGFSADCSNTKQMAINMFKEGFGGRILVETNYISFPLYLAVQAGKLVRIDAWRPRTAGERGSFVRNPTDTSSHP